MADAEDAGRNKRILVVDDQSAVRDVTLAMLDALGYQGFGANSGTQALTFLETQSVDAVLVDVAMPDLPGTEVVERMEARGYRIPVVFVTGMATHEEDLKLTTQPPQRCLLMKPYRLKDLRELLSDLKL